MLLPHTTVKGEPHGEIKSICGRMEKLDKLFNEVLARRVWAKDPTLSVLECSDVSDLGFISHSAVLPSNEVCDWVTGSRFMNKVVLSVLRTQGT
jgi:hypothetical protein